MKLQLPANTTPRQMAIVGIAVALAAPMEGLRQYAYYDPPGVLTVCYGHTGPDVRKGVLYSKAQCEALLGADMLKAVKAVESCAPGLSWQTSAALADAVLNLGPRIVCDARPAPNGSTLARRLKVGDVVGACQQLVRWDKAKIAGVFVALPGLTKRRKLEEALCLSGI